MLFQMKNDSELNDTCVMDLGISSALQAFMFISKSAHYTCNFND